MVVKEAIILKYIILPKSLCLCTVLYLLYWGVYYCQIVTTNRRHPQTTAYYVSFCLGPSLSPSLPLSLSPSLTLSLSLSLSLSSFPTTALSSSSPSLRTSSACCPPLFLRVSVATKAWPCWRCSGMMLTSRWARGSCSTR